MNKALAKIKLQPAKFSTPVLITQKNPVKDGALNFLCSDGFNLNHPAGGTKLPGQDTGSSRED
jgi:hypothetical protein